MSELFRISRAISFDVKSESDSTSETPLAARLIFWALALLTLVMLALQFGAWHEEYSFTAPIGGTYSLKSGSITLTDANNGLTFQGTVSRGTLSIDTEIVFGSTTTFMFQK